MDLERPPATAAATKGRRIEEGGAGGKGSLQFGLKFKEAQAVFEVLELTRC
jgi:hypothetical protein